MTRIKLTKTYLTTAVHISFYNITFSNKSRAVHNNTGTKLHASGFKMYQNSVLHQYSSAFSARNQFNIEKYKKKYDLY